MKLKITLILVRLVIIAFCNAALFAQGWAPFYKVDFTGKGEEFLYSLAEKNSLEGMFRFPVIATSYLIEGKMPEIPVEYREKGYSDISGLSNYFEESWETANSDDDFETLEALEALESYLAKVDAWGRTYMPESAVDGDITTAWCEGVDGPGIGEVFAYVYSPADVKKGLEIFTGFGLREDLFYKNGRPRDVSIFILEPKHMNAVDGKESFLFNQDATVIASYTHSFSDTFGWQDLPLPSASIVPVTRQEYIWLAIRINSVYPGSRWEDTLISEIREKE